MKGYKDNEKKIRELFSPKNILVSFLLVRSVPSVSLHPPDSFIDYYRCCHHDHHLLCFFLPSSSRSITCFFVLSPWPVTAACPSSTSVRPSPLLLWLHDFTRRPASNHHEAAATDGNDRDSSNSSSVRRWQHHLPWLELHFPAFSQVNLAWESSSKLWFFFVG